MGVVAMADVRNLPSFYEYEGMGVLTLSRDYQRNIVKRSAYHYAGQAIPTTRVYRNIEFSQVYTTHTCAVDYRPAPYTYTVAAGTFTSTVSQVQADSLARVAIEANGQTAANNNGTCISNYAYVTLTTEDAGGGAVNVIAHFWSDAALTIPYSANNLTITVQEEDDTDLPQEPTYKTYDIPCTGTDVMVLSGVLTPEHAVQGSISYNIFKSFTVVTNQIYVGP